MSTLEHANEVRNETAIEAQAVTATEQVQGSPEAAPESILSGATDAEHEKLAAYKAVQDEVVELAVATLDPKDMLKKYVRLGNAGLKLAAKRKASLKPGSWNGNGDLNDVCRDLETLVKMRVAIKDVRMLVYIKVALWVKAVKALVPNVEDLSYYQVSNKFLPTLEFDAEALTGEIKAGWIGWVTSTVTTQLGDEPYSMAELDAAIKDRKAEIAREKASKVDPEKALEREQKAADAKLRAERRESQSKVADAIDKAVAAGHADGADVAEIAAKILKDHKIEMPVPAGFNATTATGADVKLIARQLMLAGKYTEMVILRDTLDAMIKMVDQAKAATLKAAS